MDFQEIEAAAILLLGAMIALIFLAGLIVGLMF
jgi:hypothetical protein